MTWYRRHARVLPWRGIDDAYRTWVSEVMLQQTRVAAAMGHYHRFLARFPTIAALAAAEEAEVLTAWSGLGYYRRARMMHRAAQFVQAELGGILPRTAAELRKLPGIGDYTSAAIASIAFGESVAVLDGNVERVLVRVIGGGVSNRKVLQGLADDLVPPAALVGNAPGDHNQAMMELGATICLPRAPLCLHCPVYAQCRTRAEHPVAPRKKPLQRTVAYLLHTRVRRSGSEVLLEKRPADASLMAGMYELPLMPAEAFGDLQPVLSLRHAITTTLYRVHIFDVQLTPRRDPESRSTLHWKAEKSLSDLPLTGLARKVLGRLELLPARSATEASSRS